MFLASGQPCEFYSQRVWLGTRGTTTLMLRCAAAQSLSHWMGFRTNWKHCNVSVPSAGAPAQGYETEGYEGKETDSEEARNV